MIILSSSPRASLRYSVNTESVNGWKEGRTMEGGMGDGGRDRQTEYVSCQSLSLVPAQAWQRVGVKRAQLKVEESPPLSPVPTPQACEEAGQAGHSRCGRRVPGLPPTPALEAGACVPRVGWRLGENRSAPADTARRSRRQGIPGGPRRRNAAFHIKGVRNGPCSEKSGKLGMRSLPLIPV